MKNIPTSRIDELTSRVPVLEDCAAEIVAAADAMINCAGAGRMMYFCGNGGSCADTEHIVGELLKRFNRDRPLPGEDKEKLRELFGAEGDHIAAHLECGIRAMSLNGHPAYASAYLNDQCPELIYAQLVHVYGQTGELLMGISTSGNSSNVIHALRVAELRGLTRIGLTGADGGIMKDHTDICICAPAADTPRIQELHLPIYHWLCSVVEDAMFAPEASKDQG